MPVNGRLFTLWEHLQPTPPRCTGAEISSLPNGASTSGAEAAGPLDGVTVIDAGQAITGPLACSMLADMGADVVKVEVLSILCPLSHLVTHHTSWPRRDDIRGPRQPAMDMCN
eukprot:SAG11_NODE_8540_length_1003_cov_1.671460_1_plen_112_part_10